MSLAGYSFCFIVNEHSNSGKAGKIFRQNIALVEKHFPESIICYISRLDTLEIIVSDYSKKYDVLVACGGDGTVHTVAKYCWLNHKILGVIPLGSGNDFAKTILPLSDLEFEGHLNVLKKGVIRRVDVPVMNGNPFFNTLGIGFDGLTNLYAANTTFLSGSSKYLLAGLKAFMKAKPFKVMINSDQVSITKVCWMIIIANGGVEGGKYKISPKSMNNDEIIELVVVQAYSRFKLLFGFLLLSLGRVLPNNFSVVYPINKLCRFKFEKPQYIHFDGEIGKSNPINEVIISSDKLQVIEYPKIS